MGVCVYVCVKNNIECHTENKGNPLIKAILLVIGDLFAPLAMPTPKPKGIRKKGMFVSG